MQQRKRIQTRNKNTTQEKDETRIEAQTKQKGKECNRDEKNEHTFVSRETGGGL